MNPPLALVFAGDDNHAMLLAVALYSSLLHLKAETSVRVFVIDGGILQGHKRRIERVARAGHVEVRLHWVTPDTASLEGLKVHKHMTRAVYLDLLTPLIVPESFERAIYLDCDVLVQADLNALWKADMGQRALLAVQCFAIPYVSSPLGLANYKELGLEATTPYFNSGVMVFNLQRWRAEKLGQRVIDYLRQHPQHNNLWDQYGLNAVLANDWGQLDPSWNVEATVFSDAYWQNHSGLQPSPKHTFEHARIYHFTGPKPWRLDCEHPGKVRWRRRLEESGWFDGRHLTRATLAMPNPTMATPKVTLTIPTRNQADLLQRCLQSVLAQDHPDFRVVVLDLAVTAQTQAVVQSFNDPRLVYWPSEENIGSYGGWQLALNTDSPYLCILPDDSWVSPDFLTESIRALEAHPGAAFSAALVRYLDRTGQRLSVQDSQSRPTGLVEGLEYLHRLVSPSSCTIHRAAVMLRNSALAALGSFEPPHSRQFLDLHLYIGLASRFDVFFIDRELAQLPLHPHEEALDALEGTRSMALLAELTDAVGSLLGSGRADDPAYRAWLVGRLKSFNQYRASLSRLLVPSLNFAWAERKRLVAEEITTLVPLGDSLILIDEHLLGVPHFPHRRVLPFLERDGVFWGEPPDDPTAIQELERMRAAEAGFLVLAWPAFWWLDYYAGFFRHLKASFPCALNNDRLIAFDLRSTL